MPANPTDFLEFTQNKFSFLAPDELISIENFIQALENEPSDDIEGLTTKLSQFLSEHESIYIQLDEFIGDSNRAPSGFSKSKLDPKKFILSLRNTLLASQQPVQPNDQPQSSN